MSMNSDLVPIPKNTNIIYIFSFSSETEDWHSTRAEVSKISITTLMARCEFVLSRFLIDENNLGKGLHSYKS